MREKVTDESLSSPKVWTLGSYLVVDVGGVQGVLTLFCSGAAQVVCHALRVVELRKQLEVEEEDGDRQEEEEEVES